MKTNMKMEKMKTSHNPHRRNPSIQKKSLMRHQKSQNYFTNTTALLFSMSCILLSLDNVYGDQIIRESSVPQGTNNDNSLALHPVILIASIVASVSIVILCIALYLAWKKGQERYRHQMHEMHMTKESIRNNFHRPELMPPALPPFRREEDELDDMEESNIPLPTPSQLDDQSMISLSVVDTKNYLPAEESRSEASMESYSFSLDGYTASVANSSVAYGY